MSTSPAACFVVPYPPGREQLGGGGWVDRRLLAALVAAGCDVSVFSVTGPAGQWDEGGIAGASAGDVPLEVRDDRRALARIVTTMLRSTQPYLAAKFTSFDGWRDAAVGLAAAAEGRSVVTSGWPSLLLADAADVAVDVHVAHNVDTVIARSHSPRPLRLLGEVRRLGRLERSLLRRPRSVVTLSRTDAVRLRDWGVPATAMPLPLHAVEGQVVPHGRDVGFIGKATWPPNAEALEVLLGPVHDALTAAGADVGFRLAGSGTERFAAHPRVARAGWIDDVAELYAEIGVVVVPRMGVSTGVSVKMLEAAEHGVPVITTDTLARAIDPDGPWIVADTPAAIAAAIGEVDPVDCSARVLEWARGHDQATTGAALIALL
jgi:glycosyltransferase involved in cell wall biosynthesis